MAEGTFRLHLLGPFRLLDAEGRRVSIPSRRAMALIALLAEGGGERTRSWLQERLWGSRDEAQAQGSLRRELSTLRALLSNAGNCFVHADSHSIWLERSRLGIDIDARGDLPCGEFLEGLDIPGEESFEDWLRERRSAYTSTPLRAGYALSVRASAQLLIPFLKPKLEILAALEPRPPQAGDTTLADLADEVGLKLTDFGTVDVVAPTDPDESRHRLQLRLSDTGEQIRIWARLLSSSGGRQLWAERFEEPKPAPLNSMSAFALLIARRVDSAIEREEMRQAMSGDSDDPSSLYWRANAGFRVWTSESLDRTIALCERAHELAPTHPWPSALAAFCRAMRLASGSSPDARADQAAALSHAASALQLGPDDPSTLGYVSGAVLVAGGDIAQAERSLERAASLGSGYASLPFWRGWLCLCLGRVHDGLSHLSEAAEINPRSAVRPFQQSGIALALVLLGRSAEAVPYAEEAAHHLPANPLTLAALCAALAQTGQTKTARAAWDRLAKVDPALQSLFLIRDPATRNALLDVLGMARAEEGTIALRPVT